MVRRRILTVTLSAVLLAAVLLGLPLSFAIRNNAFNEERGELERVALRAAVAVSPSYRNGDQVELPGSGAGVRLGLYAADGRLVSGSGPSILEPALAAARRGSVADSTTGRELIEAVPVSVGEKVIGIVRASSTRASVRATVFRQLAALGAVILLALTAAGALSFWQARRLTRSMQQLMDAATDLGAGDFSVRPISSGVPEIDRTAEALTVTARRLEEQITRERAFASQASHQLRTPLTRLQLELESGLVQEALGTAEHLSRTIDDVLALAREPHSATSRFDVEELLTECAAEWRGVFATDDRPLRLVVDDPPEAGASRTAVRQVVQVLIDNAYQHGSGVVTLTARASGGAVAIDVTDEGTGAVTWPSDDARPGRLGLAMARSVADAQGGRLLLASDEHGTRFTMLVPAVTAPAP